MIEFTRLETRQIDEEALFEDLKEFLFGDETFNKSNDYVDIVQNLPKDVQRIIFARMGAMLIDFAKNGVF